MTYGLKNPSKIDENPIKTNTKYRKMYKNPNMYGL